MKKWILSNGYEIYIILKGRINVYLISTPNGNLLVDTGIRRSRLQLLRNIKSLELPNSSISYLLLTHTHFDHCQNAAFLKKEMNLKIITSKEDEDYTINGYTPLPKGTNEISRLLLVFGKRIGKKWFGYQEFAPDKTVKDYLSMADMGFQIEIISTPGHSSGSISILVNKEIAIVGDAMFGIFRNSIFPPFADDEKELFKSWKKLLDTGCNLFLPGHGGEISRELVKKELNKITKKLSP
jgi:glyoxylase-like metal-dependent hydrolase (beta-lactamase superfamily II)